jgi:hypothetical protein
MAMNLSFFQQRKTHVFRAVLMMFVFGVFPSSAVAFLPALHVSFQTQSKTASFVTKSFAMKGLPLRLSTQPTWLNTKKGRRDSDRFGTMMAESTRKVCILGGGFGGLYTALKLANLGQLPNVVKPEITLIDANDRSVILSYDCLISARPYVAACALVSTCLHLSSCPDNLC